MESVTFPIRGGWLTIEQSEPSDANTEAEAEARAAGWTYRAFCARTGGWHDICVVGLMLQVWGFKVTSVYKDDVWWCLEAFK